MTLDSRSSRAREDPRKASPSAAALADASPNEEKPDPVREMESAFARAMVSGAAMQVESYCFAGRATRVRALGAALARHITRPFAHLRVPPNRYAAPSLCIDIWDESETGVPAPGGSFAADHGRRWLACGGTLEASSDHRYLSFRCGDAVTVMDRHAQRIVACRRSGADLPHSERSKPLLLLLSVWYPDRAVQMLHAGLVARGEQGILLPGNSGTGKSTTALASIAQGLDYLADDFVGVEAAADGTVRGHSVFSTGCLAGSAAGVLPEPQAGSGETSSDDDKSIFHLSEMFPDRVRATVPIAAVALLRIRAGRTEILPATRGEALRQLASSTLHTVVPRPGRAALERMTELVQRVPAYWLLLGPDLRDIRPNLDQILSKEVGAAVPDGLSDR